VNLQVEIRWLKARVAMLEAALAARPARRKRECAPRPTDSVVLGRRELWARLVLLHAQYGHGRLTKLRFVVKYHLGDPSEFCRFLSTQGRRSVAEGSVPALRFYQALRDSIGELAALRDAHGHFHGKILPSHDSAARTQ
jgi:hypothetical protein